MELLLLVALLATLALASLASDLPLSTGYNIAVGKSDPNWEVAFNGGKSASGFVTGTTYQVTSKFANWITPVVNDSSAEGDYTFTVTWDLRNYDAKTYSLAAKVAADNSIKSVSLNAANVAVATPCNSLQYSCTTTYKLSGPFVQGTNTLSFVVYNEKPAGAFNPVALFVEFMP